MTLDLLQEQLRSGQWFNRLGTFSTRDGYLAITSQSAWATFTAHCMATEFGLHRPANGVEGMIKQRLPPNAETSLLSSFVKEDQPCDDNEQTTILQRMEWLPTDQSEEDPFHGTQLIDQIECEGNSEPLKKGRLMLCRTALAGLRNTESNSWLSVGATNYTEAAKQGLLFAIRMATSEIMAQKTGIWCACCGLYVEGHWPLGRLSTGHIIVL